MNREGWLAVSAFVVGILLIFGIVMMFGYGRYLTDNAHYDQFLKSCVQEHKEYECVLMWRKS